MRDLENVYVPNSLNAWEEGTSLGKPGRRLVICSPGVPHETEGASTVVFYSYIEAMRKAGFQILHILLFQPGQDNESSLSEYVARMQIVGGVEVFACAAESFVETRRFSIRLNRQVAATAQDAARQFEPDVVFCLDLLSAWVLDGFDGAPKLVWLGDLNFQTQLYHALYATRENPISFPGIPLMWIHSRIWRRIYRQVLEGVDSVIIASASSRKQLLRLGIESMYEPYPWPNKTSSKPPNSGPQLDIPTFLFFGTLAALGSRSAFHFMVRTLYPRLLHVWGSGKFQILVCGSRGLPEWVQRALASKPEIKFLGFVDDIDHVMAQCHAVLVPIEVPVGNRSRILTAMAKGTLVIAHKNAALGNPDLIDSKTCYLARTADEFLDRMQRASRGGDEVRSIVQEAYRLYNDKFRPDAATARMITEVLRVAEHAKP